MHLIILAQLMRKIKNKDILICCVLDLKIPFFPFLYSIKNISYRVCLFAQNLPVCFAEASREEPSLSGAVLLQNLCPPGLANDPSEVQSISTDAVYAEQTMRSFNMLSEVMPNKLRTEPWESLVAKASSMAH